MMSNHSNYNKLDVEFDKLDFRRQTIKDLIFTVVGICLSMLAFYSLVKFTVTAAYTGDEPIHYSTYTVLSKIDSYSYDTGSGIREYSDSNYYLVKVDESYKNRYFIIKTLSPLDKGYTSIIYMAGDSKNTKAVITLEDSITYFSNSNLVFYVVYQFISLTIIVLILTFVVYMYTRYKVIRQIQSLELVEEQNRKNPSLHLSLWVKQ